jgi:hypothetical protein
MLLLTKPRSLTRLLAVGAAFALAPAGADLAGQAHPRLLFGPADVAALRDKITRQPYQTMYNLLLADAETGQYGVYTGPTPENPGLPADPYGECINAMRLGFLYVLTGDDYYANRARFYVDRRIHDTTVHRWAFSGQKGLNLYFNGKSVAMVYDWCHGAPSWDAAFTAEVSAALIAQGNVIADSGGTEQNTNSASNWQGLRGSSAVLCFLASDDAHSSTRFSNMYAKTRNYLRDNLGTSSLSRGWNIEGIGYLGYPYAAVIPAAISALRANPANDMLSDLAAIDYACWTQYAATVRFLRGDEVWLVHPDFGDDNATADDANGAYGFAFELSHPDLIPGLHYWYQRLLVPELNYDYTRGGTIFSILYYPEEVVETPPLEIPAWRDGFIDTGGNGFFTYRNQYEDETDMVAQMYLKLRGNKGHNGPDALSFRILGLNTAWAVGGGRYGIKTNGQDVFWRSQNTLYPVDPDSRLSINGNSGSVVGTPAVHPAGDGHVVSRISRNNVGATNHKRWFASDHSRDAGVEAVYIIADRSDDGFYWQFNTLDENTISATADGFMVEGMDGATLKGTFLYPTGNHNATTGTRPRGSKFCYGLYGEYNHFYHLRGSGDYLVVLTVAKAGQVHPPVSLVQGRVDPAVVEVGDSRYAILAETVERDPAPLSLPAAPPAPSGFSATPSSNFPEVLLQWQPVAGADGYIVERSDDGGPFVAVANLKASATSTVDNDLPSGVDYHYRVKAWTGGGDGPATPVATARTAGAGAGYIAIESFEEYPLGQIGGNNGPGGWQGAWTYGDSAVVDVSAQPLAANGVAGGDRALDLGWGDIIGTRLFADAIPSNGYGDGVWFSYLLKWESGSIGADDTAWLFNTVGNRDWAYAGLSGNGAFRVSDAYKSGTTSTGVMAPGQTVQVVVKVTNTQIRLWIDPAAETDAPLLTYGTTNSKGWKAGFPGLGISSRSTTDNFLIDRIVVARSFDAIMQEPSGRAPYEIWRDSHSWPDEASALPGADPDKDGLTNEQEFIHGGDPLRPGPAFLRMQADGHGGMACRVQLRGPAALDEFILQASSTLDGGWTELDPSAATFESAGGRTFAVIPLPLEPGESTRFVRALYPE